MHKELRTLLEKATGKSEFVIAINVDIRGFSSFSMNVESPEVALFIKKVYLKLIDEYFPNASFFKPTGDGLLVTVPYTEDTLQTVATESINACFRALADFPIFCANDAMITFKVPEKLGIGLSKGIVCCLTSEGKTIDYSGRVLNLASRLMDFARPSGIVFDSSLRMDLLPRELREKFSEDKVYIRGIAEKEPIQVYYTKDLTSISPLSKHPIEEIHWDIVRDTKTLGKIKKLVKFRYYLPSKPSNSSEINVTATCKMTKNGKIVRRMQTIYPVKDYEYGEDAGQPIVVIDFPALVEYLEVEGVKNNNWPIKIEIKYPKV